ncbi:hypothetical protein [Nocardia sp. BMG51109]|uniref:hypothetical protein n=1 Tax=Nocardia sp. BMG51109 TaxID=1056816 RepID=UPI001E4EE939|nr:hypothetical protein [Nocardia sp. BMG51109]
MSDEVAGGAGLTKEITEPVTVSDNGIRSLVPPTFCFELRDCDGALVDVVSRVVLDELRDFDALEALPADRPAALGHITNYDAGAPARVRGREFVIDQVLPMSN